MRVRIHTAFTLIEVTVVVVIAAVLLGVLIPAVQRAREKSRRTQCAQNVRDIGLALHQFNAVNRQLPPIHWQDPSDIEPDYFGQPHPRDNSYYFSWLTRILPYLGEAGLYNQIDFESNAFTNAKTHSRGFVNSVELPNLLCPSNPRNEMVEHTFEDGHKTRYAFTNYLAVNGTDQFSYDGVIYINSRTKIERISDGTSKTLMTGERPPSFDGWYGWWFAGAGLYPWFGAADIGLGTAERIAGWQGKCRHDSSQSHYQNGSVHLEDDGSGWDKHAWHFWSFHPGGSHFLFADGHVDFIDYSIDKQLFHNLGTRNGHEVIDDAY